MTRFPLLSRLPAYFDLDGDPVRLAGVMVRTLAVGYVVMDVIAVVRYLAAPGEGMILEVAAWTVLGGWAILMLRRKNPHPVRLLLAAALAACGHIVASTAVGISALGPTTSHVVILTASGTVGMVTSRKSRELACVMLGLVVVATVAVETGSGAPVTSIATDALLALVALGTSFLLVGATRSAADEAVMRYRLLVASTPVGVVEADLSSLSLVGSHIAGRPKVLLMNDRAHTIFNRFSSSMDGAPSVLSRAIKQVLVTVVRERNLDGTTTCHVEAGDETFMVSWRAADRTLGHIVFSIVDVTAQEQAARALTDQIRARDQFVATVSHELRTPLTGAMGLLEILDGPDVEDEAERRTLLRTALDQTRDMADIIQDLLVAARVDSGGLTIVPERLDARAVVASALVGIEPAIRVGDIPDIRLYADPVRVRQIIRNLATNANRYGGPLRRVVVRRTRAEVLVEVRDNGTPLDVQFRDRIFEPYARAEGTSITASVGIGLTVSRTLARLMNGDLDYRHDGTEAIFTLRLPVA